MADGWLGIGRPYLTAYAHFRQAETILATRGEREHAAAPLREAHAISVRLGAEPLRRELEVLARQARIEVASLLRSPAARPPDEDGPFAGFGLTDREEEVFRLVAGGWSNQQIADALFISRKTASVHVSNILGKLGVGSRVEAAAVAHRLGFSRDAPPPPDTA